MTQRLPLRVVRIKGRRERRARAALGDRESDGSAKVEIGEVGSAKEGIVRHHRVQGDVDTTESKDTGTSTGQNSRTMTILYDWAKITMTVFL